MSQRVQMDAPYAPQAGSPADPVNMEQLRLGISSVFLDGFIVSPFDKFDALLAAGIGRAFRCSHLF